MSSTPEEEAAFNEVMQLLEAELVDTVRLHQHPWFR